MRARGDARIPPALGPAHRRAVGRTFYWKLAVQTTALLMACASLLAVDALGAGHWGFSDVTAQAGLGYQHGYLDASFGPTTDIAAGDYERATSTSSSPTGARTTLLAPRSIAGGATATAPSPT